MVAPGRCDPPWVTLAESDLALSVQLKNSFMALALVPGLNCEAISLGTLPEANNCVSK